MKNERDVSELAGKLRLLSACYSLRERKVAFDGADPVSLGVRPRSSVMKQLHRALMLCGNLYIRLVAPRPEDVRPDPLAAMDQDGFIRRRLTDPAEQTLAVLAEEALELLGSASQAQIDPREFSERAKEIAAGLEGAIGVKMASDRAKGGTTQRD